MRYDFSHYNGIGLPKEKEPELYEFVHPMSQKPAMNCEIYLLQNSVSITSVGNVRSKLLVKYIMAGNLIYDEASNEECDWREAHLKNSQEKPKCWIYKSDLINKLKYRGQ